MSCLVFASLFAVYLSSTFPSLGGGDAGRWAAAAHTLGGAPLIYGLLGKMALVFIPFGSPAFRLNVLSGLLASGAALFLFRAAKVVIPRGSHRIDPTLARERERWHDTALWLAILTAFLFPPSLGPAITAGPGALMLFLLSALAWSAAGWLDLDAMVSKNNFLRRLALSALLLGLASSLTPLSLLAGASLCPLFLRRRPQRLFDRPMSLQKSPKESVFLPLSHYAAHVLVVIVFFGMGYALPGNPRPFFQPLFLAPLLTFGLAAALGFGLFQMGNRLPNTRLLAGLLLPVLLAAAPFRSARGDLGHRNEGVNALTSLPPDSTLWNPTQDMADSLLYQKTVLSNRADVTVASGTPVATAMIFSDDPRNFLPALFPRDILPCGLVYRYFPAATNRLVAPAAQLSLARTHFWWHRRARDAKTIYADAHFRLGLKMAEHLLADLSEEEYVSALAENPGHAGAHTRLGLLAFERRNFGGAAVHFKRALGKSGKDMRLLILLGQCLMETGNASQALAVFQEAARAKPGDPGVERCLADALEKNNRPREALFLWKKLSAQNTEDKHVYWRLANTQSTLGQGAKALETLREYELMNLTPQEKAALEDFRQQLLTPSNRRASP